ncbi:uncharacterized protein LOC135116322 [Scylla paramamosain]|uniref:uncharacterized protein LOC135116322 n=1 Tax=Scylla paramamosain TaxID=85552 RepID=UPI003083DE60
MRLVPVLPVISSLTEPFSVWCSAIGRRGSENTIQCRPAVTLRGCAGSPFLPQGCRFRFQVPGSIILAGSRSTQPGRHLPLISAAPRRAATLRPELEQGWVERSHRGFWGNLRPDELIPEPILDDPRISPEVTWQAHSLRGAPTAGNAVAAAAFPWVLYDRLCAYPGLLFPCLRM